MQRNEQAILSQTILCCIGPLSICQIVIEQPGSKSINNVQTPLHLLSPAYLSRCFFTTQVCAISVLVVCASSLSTMDNTSQNLTDQCGTYNYPISCPVQRPVNGHGGSCVIFTSPTITRTNNPQDHVPFYISVCNIDFLASDSDPSNPNATYGHFDQQIPGVLYSTYTLQENLSWHQIDRFYRQNSTIAVIHSICLTLGILTLLNILSLTPASKRLKASFWILLSGAICVIVSSACALQLNTSDTSAYLQLTNDWVSTTWSVGYKARTIACQSGEIIGLIFLQVALYIQAKAILTWVKLRNEKVYYSVLLFLGLMGIAAWCWRAIWGMYQIRFLAFVPEGGYRPSYFELWPGTYYVKFSNGFVGASLGLWCLVILVSSVQTILARNEALFRSDIHGGARKWRESTVRTTYESAVRCIGFVSVQSFAVPSK